MFARKRVAVSDWLTFTFMVLALPGFCLGQALAPAEKDLPRVLGIQRALGEGREALTKGDFATAVQALERQLGNIQGDKEFLSLLRQAYQGHAQSLSQAGNTREAETFQRRLRILENGLEKAGPQIPPNGPQIPAMPALARQESEGSSALASRLAQPVAKVEVVGAVSVVPGQPVQMGDGRPSNGGKNGTFRGNLDDQPRAGKLAQDANPFSWDNSEEMYQFRSLIAGADQAFSKSDFSSALALYTQAWQKQPKLSQAAKDRWAYCRVHALTAKANKDGADPAFAAELGREVSQVRALTGKFDQYLQKLVANPEVSARARGATVQGLDSGNSTGAGMEAIVVAHDSQPAGEWRIAQTHHFRVFHKLDKESADRVARVAELTRQIQGGRWFGGTAIPWETKCDLYVHLTGNDYSRATGVPPSSPGHSTVKVEGGRVSHRRIDLHSDDPNMMVGVLPHETTHVVLAGNLGSGLVPRWADEGMSVLSEPQDRIERHTRQMTKLEQEGGLFPLKQLLELRDYPEQGRVGTFYAQSVSVVQFMAGLKGHQVFSRFLKDGMVQGYDAALQTHYGVRDWREMDRAWRANALQGASVASR